MIRVIAGAGMAGVAFAFALLGAAAPAGAGQVTFQVLGDLPGGRFRSESAGVSADGSAVAGVAFVDEPRANEAFHWTLSGGMVGLGVLPLEDANSLARAISGDGRTVVGWTNGRLNGAGLTEAFRWTKETGMRGMGFLRPGDTDSTAVAASYDGSVIVGGSGSFDSGMPQAFRWTQATGMVPLGNLPGGDTGGAEGVSADGSVIVGSSGTSAAGLEGFRWTERTGMVGLGQGTIARGVSADGRVVVGTNGHRAVRWTEDGRMEVLADPGESSSAIAWAASADGSVVVGETNERAFVWDAGHGLRDLTDLLRASGALDEFPDGLLIHASGVSADGTVIVGDGQGISSDTRDTLVWRAQLVEGPTVIPLPSALGAGLAGLAAVAAAMALGRRRLYHF